MDLRADARVIQVGLFQHVPELLDANRLSSHVRNRTHLGHQRGEGALQGTEHRGGLHHSAEVHVSGEVFA